MTDYNDQTDEKTYEIKYSKKGSIMTEATPNQQRANYVTDMLAFNEHYGDTEPTNLQDLLSDLMHLCNGKGYDFTEILRIATDNFNAEVMDGELEKGVAA